ncbi:unnamed protein product [Effrenium voratum]|nr:unnamed protein product [Effrenium voratum]
MLGVLAGCFLLSFGSGLDLDECSALQTTHPDPRHSRALPAELLERLAAPEASGGRVASNSFSSRLAAENARLVDSEHPGTLPSELLDRLALRAQVFEVKASRAAPDSTRVNGTDTPTEKHRHGGLGGVALDDAISRALRWLDSRPPEVRAALKAVLISWTLVMSLGACGVALGKVKWYNPSKYLSAKEVRECRVEDGGDVQPRLQSERVLLDGEAV